MTPEQKNTALSVLDHEASVRERRGRDRRAEAVRMPDNAFYLEQAAELLEREADALRATLALVEHYTPAAAVTEKA